MVARGMTLTDTVVFVTEECCNCGIPFAITQDLKDRRLKDHKSFYCPNGHSQHYTGKTEEQKLREQLERANQRVASRDEDLRVERASHAATKGQLTKAKKRAAHGVCPCCKRTFANVARHVAGQHPDFVEAHG